MNKNKFFKNVATGFGGQLVVIVLGLLIPRVMIKSYGSDINGLISTITQIFTYMALLEAGIGQAARNALYKPITDRNQEDISEVVSTSKAYFGRVTLYYAIGVVLLAVVSPFVLKTNVDFIAVVFIILFEGFSGVLSFYFIQTPTIMLNADGKGYINNVVTLTNKIVGYLFKIILAYCGVSIVILQFVYLLITVIKVFIYKWYFSAKYKWLSFNQKPKFELLNDRNSFILTEVAWTIFSSTDMIVLSMFISTQLSSVYSVYNMIFTNLNLLLNSVAHSISYILGLSFHENIKKYEIIHDSLTSIYLGTITILMSISYILILPFMKLYTDGIADINYIYTSLPLLFCLVQMLSWSRNVPGNLTGIAGYAKPTSIISLIEAGINLTLSVILVNKLGIVGVLLATVIALPLKVLWCIYIADKKVMKRSYRKSLSILGINYLFFFVVVELSKFFQPTINSYGQFFLWGAILTLAFSILGMGLNFLVNRQCWHVVRRYILKR